MGEFMAKLGRKMMGVMAHAMTQDSRRWEAFKQQFEVDTGTKLPADFQPEDLDPSHYKVTTNPQVSVALSFSTLEPVTLTVASKGWRFLMTSEPLLFITSDFPFGILDPVSEGTFYGPALASPKTEVSIALTKTIALLAGGEMEGTQWVNAPERIVAQINARTMMRASMLVSSKPTAHGLRLNGQAPDTGAKQS